VIYSVPPTTNLASYSYINNLMNTMLSYAQVGDADGKLFNEAYVSALTKIADQKVNLAVAFAEARKSLDLLVDAAGRIYRGYRAFRRRDPRGIARALNITPSRLHKSWLEYKYGWMPLLMDVKGSAEFVAQHHFGRAPRFSVIGTAKRTYKSVKTVPYTFPGGGPTVPIVDTLTGEILCKVKIEVEVRNPLLSTAQQLGLTNPALVAWELTPFSFVFDWFISVGDYLTALTALHGVDVVRSFKSYTSEIYVDERFAGAVYKSGGVTYGHSFEQRDMRLREYQRTPFTANPLLIYPPRRENPLNTSKVITALTLLRGKSRLLDAHFN
jgi:hypothetical protein